MMKHKRLSQEEFTLAKTNTGVFVRIHGQKGQRATPTSVQYHQHFQNCYLDNLRYDVVYFCTADCFYKY